MSDPDQEVNGRGDVMLGATIQGNESRPSCRAVGVLGAARRWTTGGLWKRCCLALGPGCLGGLCRRASAPGRMCLGAGVAGRKARDGRRGSRTEPGRPTPNTRGLTAPWCGPTNPARARRKRGRKPSPGTEPGRREHENAGHRRGPGYTHGVPGVSSDFKC